MKRRQPQHPTQIKPPKQITYRVVKTLRDIPLKEGNPSNRLMTWVVAWTNGEPRLEIRRVYQKDGVIKTYRQKGIDKADFLFILEHSGEILEALDKP